MAKENSCLTRVATGAVIGGAIGGAVDIPTNRAVFTKLITLSVISFHFHLGSVYGTYEALRFKVPGFLKIRHIGQRTVSSAALFGLFLGAGSLIHCGKSY